MNHQDIQIPIFGRAGNSSAQSDWADGDNFDVELLAEYLLDNESTLPSVAFEFNRLDNTGLGGGGDSGSGIVSPEQSEDGGLSPLGEWQQQQHLAPQMAASAASVPMPPAAAPTPLPPFTPFMAVAAPGGMAPSLFGIAPFMFSGAPAIAPTPGMVYDQHGVSAPAPSAMASVHTNAANKKRRVDQAGMAAVSMPSQPLAFNPGAPLLAHSMPLITVSGMNPAALLNGQQLAVAAAQAMAQAGRGPRKKSQAQIDRRRERNRILARRTRLRKKFFFESLQKEVLDLQKENGMLKELVKLNLKEEHSKPLLEECDAMAKMPPSVLEALGETEAEYDSKDFNLVRSIQNSQHSFVITDPSLQDNPIVFASDDFCKMTGYKREQVLGRNCRFLQGALTDKEKAKKVRLAVSQGEDVTVTFVNYTAGGKPFWNKLFIAALRDAQNNIVNFIGVSVKVACPLPDDPEHGKVLPGQEDDDDDDGKNNHKDDNDLDDDDDDDDDK